MLRLRDHPRALSVGLSRFLAMDRHRLPGMSVSSEEWAVLAARAEALGITRTELIRRSIARTVQADDCEPEIAIGLLQDELVAARRQLALVRTALEIQDAAEPDVIIRQLQRELEQARRALAAIKTAVARLPGHDPLAAA